MGTRRATAAYYLALNGHDVTILEALPKPGGMLRYGIPTTGFLKSSTRRYSITDLGAQIRVNQRRQGFFDSEPQGQRLSRHIPGYRRTSEHPAGGAGETDGVLAGTDFLRAVAAGEPVEVGNG